MISPFRSSEIGWLIARLAYANGRRAQRLPERASPKAIHFDDSKTENGAGCDVDVGFHSSVSRRGETPSYKKSIDFCRAGEYRPPVLARGCFLRAYASLRTRSIQPKNRETDSRVSSYKVEAR